MAGAWKKRYISTKFWDDNFIISLDPIEKLLFMYFLSNPLTNVCGIYEIAIRRVAFDTWIEWETIQRIIIRFSKEKRLYYIDWFVFLPNSYKHQNLWNGNIRKSIEKTLKELPQSLVRKLMTLNESSMSHLWLSNNLDLDLDINTITKKEQIVELIWYEKSKKYKTALMCLRKLMDYWYKIPATKESVEEWLYWLREKWLIYGYKTPQGHIDYNEMYKKFDRRYEWHSGKWDKVQNYKSSILSFLNPNKPVKWAKKSMK